MNNFFEELKRRNVYKVATAYVVTSWLIIQVVNTIGPNLNLPETIPGLITKILIVGFPIALILAWLYELTPQGFKRTSKEQQDPPDNRNVGKKLNRIIIISLTLVVALMLVERFFFRGPLLYNDQQEASIAVLPFADMSPGDNNEYFADGLSEQILDELAQVNGLKVTARTSSFAFKGKNEDMRSIGEKLSVNYLLEGSVRYDEKSNRIKITTQLINTATGYHIWSKTYDDDFDAIFDIQEDVGRSVAKELRVRLLPEDQRFLTSKMTENKEAYKLYLESKKYSSKIDDKDLGKAIELLNKSIQIDPDFAEAHAELSSLYNAYFFLGNMNKKEKERLTKLHLEKAIALAPHKPEVLVAKSRDAMNKRLDSTQVISDLREAITLKPSYAAAHNLLGYALLWAKQSESGTISLEKALELDPLNENYATMLAQRYYYRYRDYEKAFGILDKIIENDSASYASRSKALMVANSPFGDLVQSFKLIHAAGKKETNQMLNLNYHVMSGLTLDLLPLSEKYLKILQMRYPDNEDHTFDNTSFMYSVTKDYSSWKEWIDFWADEKNLDPNKVAIERTELNLEMGDYEKAKQILLETRPHLKNPDISKDSLDYRKASDQVLYTEILRRNGENNKADALSTIICDFYQSKIEQDTLMLLSFKYEYLLSCHYLHNDVENFVKTLDEQFFDVKQRLEVFNNIQSGSYKRFDTIPEYMALVTRITEETHRMRSEVIEYLESEGDWDPSWYVELGID